MAAMDSQPVEVTKQKKEPETEATEKPDAPSEASEVKVAQNLFEQVSPETTGPRFSKPD